MEIINISNKLRDFEEHLNLNRQTIVSAKFGDGKTYFLNQYIESHKDDTFFIVLHPVNYIVSSNEDIFEYIKRDILCSLVHRSEFQEINWDEALKELLSYDTMLETIDTIATNIPCGNLLTLPFHLFKKVDDKFAVDKYFDRFKNTKGGLFEFDQFTFAIQRTLNEIKKNGLRTILIIEDLDRIDPEHLFRILNVLGAHVDEDKNTNKFGFDNIIAVLDYETTEHIFHHFYGAQANYKGYMSKFMTSYPFRYSITEVARDQLLEYFKNECHIELLDEFPKDINGKSLLETVNNLSVREIVQILDNINNQIDPADVELPYRYKTYSNDYITRFLAVLVRMGYKVSNNALVEYYTDEFEHFRILNNYLLASGIYNNPLFEFNGSWCGYSVRHDGDYKFISRTGGVGGDIVNTPIVDVVVKAIDTAIDKVKDGKQILVYNELEG
jgi:hypothetical protein